jgi:ketosteroid isomerase-like protein
MVLRSPISNLRLVAHVVAALFAAVAAARGQQPMAAPPPPAVADEAGEALRQAVSAAETAFAGAFAARDRERFFSFVHPDAVFLGPGGPLRGKAAVVAAWSCFFAGSPVAPFSWRPVVAEAHGDIGLTQGPVHDAEGKWVANFSSVWQRQPDGRWLVVFDGAPPCRPLGEPAPEPTPAPQQ